MFFQFITPITYWVLIALWVFILFFYLRRIISKNVGGTMMFTLMVILSIDAFRTLVESIYFGAWYTSLAGFIPSTIHAFLVQPEMVFIPKIFNVLAALIIIAILLFKWIPQESAAIESLELLVRERTTTLTNEIEHRKRIEEQVHSYADNLRKIFNSTPNALILVGEERKIEDINDKGMQVTGKTRHNLQGKYVGEAFNCLNSRNQEGCGRTPACLDCPINSKVLSTLNTGKRHNLEEGQFKSFLQGTETTTDFLISTDRLEIDGKSKILISLVDITANKRTERALRKSEERFNLAMEASRDGIYDWDLESNTIYYSPGWKRMLGYEPHELPDTLSVWEKLVAPEEIKPSWSMLNALIEGKRDRFEKEYKMRHKNGHWVDILSRANVYKTKDSNQLRIVGTHVDITEQKRDEEELNFQAMLINKIQENIVATDLNGKIIYVNEAACKTINRNKDEILGQSIEIYGEDTKRGASQQYILQTTLREGKWRGEVVNLSNDGREILIDLRTTLIRDKLGNPTSMVGVSTDITEQEKISRQLQQAHKMEVMGTLAGGIAHDFNNILAPILGYSEMLLDIVPSGDKLTSTSLNQIHDSALRASELVKQILTFSRQERTEYKPIKIQPIIKESVKLIRAAVPKHISIIYDIDESCPAVNGDATQVHQVVMNLMTNAYNAIDKADGEIMVTLSQEDVRYANDNREPDVIPGNYACLTVKDSGDGIKPELLENIFDPFFTTKEKGKGTGMGLSVTHGIVEKMMGCIKVHSDYGYGAEFKVFLPLVSALPVSAEGDSLGPKNLEGTEHILLVDDETPILDIQQTVLERLGYKVTTNNYPLDALNAFKASPDTFDLVITDLSMPGMTGTILAAELLKIKPGIPILICTGFSDQISQNSIKSFGLKGLLLKPVLKKELAQKIREALYPEDTE